MWSFFHSFTIQLSSINTKQAAAYKGRSPSSSQTLIIANFFQRIPNRSKLGIGFWAVVASCNGWFWTLGTSGEGLDGWKRLKLAGNWNTIFQEPCKNLPKFGCVFRLGFRPCGLYMLLGIYRSFWNAIRVKKDCPLNVRIFFNKFKSNIWKILIFFPCKRLARIWNESWAFLDI